MSTSALSARLALYVLVLVGAFGTSAASDFPDSTDIANIRACVDAGFREDYSAACSLAVRLQWKYPYHPIGFVLHATMLQSEMMDDEQTLSENEFRALIDLAKKKAADRLDSIEDDPWSWYCLGLARGSKAVFESRSGSWISTVREGIGAKNAFLECIKRNPQFYDAFVGIGSFHYWRTVKTGAINWLPFVQDDRDEGISELTKAADSALFSSDLARDALVWVYIDSKKFEMAESLATAMSARYPDSRKPLWELAFAYFYGEKWSEAADLFESLLDRLPSDQPYHAYNLIEAIYYETVSLEKEQDWSALSAVRVRFESLQIDESIRKRQKDKLKEIESILHSAESRLAESGSRKGNDAGYDHSN